MRTLERLLSASIACALCALAGCASVPQEELEKRAAEIKVYAPAELSGVPYESVGHVWVSSWRTAFFAPTYPGKDEAVSSLRAEAARLGANGIVNIVCLDENAPRKSTNEESAVLCYANAIRVRPSEG
jgi:hypothetical protein